MGQCPLFRHIYNLHVSLLSVLREIKEILLHSAVHPRNIGYRLFLSKFGNFGSDTFHHYPDF